MKIKIEKTQEQIIAERKFKYTNLSPKEREIRRIKQIEYQKKLKDNKTDEQKELDRQKRYNSYNKKEVKIKIKEYHANRKNESIGADELKRIEEYKEYRKDYKYGWMDAIWENTNIKRPI